MARWGCVDVPALPLQLLILHHPDWARYPVAVVDRDEPQGTILWVNERARRDRVRPGLRYAQALSLAAGLRAGVVDGKTIQSQVDHLARRLRKFTPEVEPSADEPGVFWLNASGFERLFPSLEVWASSIRRDLQRAGFWSAVVVGFDRFNTYALSKVAVRSANVQVLATARQERQKAGRVPLDRLDLEPSLRDSLERLGAETVADLRQLPAGGLLERFGRESYLLHRLVTGRQPAPLAPTFETEPVRERFELEPEQHQLDATTLLFLLKQRLAIMQETLAERGEAVAALHLRLLLEGGATSDHQVQPAEPTLDEVQLVDLLRLRIDALKLPVPTIGFELLAEGMPATSKQLQLFANKPRRDLKAANRALARLRAELGEAAVVRAVLLKGHLPEAGFGWQPVQKITVARPTANTRDTHPRLVRRILARPEFLTCQRGVPDGWFAHGLGPGPVQALFGPYLVSGGWWRRPQHREYYFAETRRGDLLWIYFDRPRRRWFLHGRVE